MHPHHPQSQRKDILQAASARTITNTGGWASFDLQGLCLQCLAKVFISVNTFCQVACANLCVFYSIFETEQHNVGHNFKMKEERYQAL